MDLALINNDSSYTPETESLHFVGSVLASGTDGLVGSTDFVEYVKTLVGSVGALCLGQTVYDFADAIVTEDVQSGFTAVFLLAESHIAVHTWPEHKVAEVDVYLCNYLNDNRQKCEELFDGIVKYFDPVKVVKQGIKRPRAERMSVVND